jgi:hypothetical protein
MVSRPGIWCVAFLLFGLAQTPGVSVAQQPGGGGGHFARSVDEAVLVAISGFGPTNTQYVSSADAPRPSDR